MYSIEIERNPYSLARCLDKLVNGIPDFEYEWHLSINAGGIDYGVYFNIDVERKELEICNQPNGDGEDSLDDVLELFKEDDDEDED